MNNKYFPIFVSCVMACKLLTSNVFADAQNDILNIVNIKKSILIGENNMSIDISNDGNMNVLDVIQLKHDILYNNEVVQDYSATDENVKIISRYVIKDNITWLNQSGSAIEFEFTGTSLDITINGDTSSSSQNSPRFAIFFNDELIIDELISAKEKVINVISSNNEVSGIVKVIKLSEAANGSIGVGNIAIKSSSENPIIPVAKKNLTIEFIGDSITCGYGVDASNENESFSTATENFMRTYAYLTAKQLDADYSTLCYSGYGVISGATSGDGKNIDALIPSYYDGVSKQWDYKDYKWNFENNPVDIVLLNLGTNDYTYIKYDFENRSVEFIEGYIDFLKLIREKNPNAKIICTMGLMGGYEVYDYIQEAILEYTSQTGDDNISSFRLTVQNPNNGLGAGWHPSAKTHELCAEEVVQAIQDILN